jgi:hypothetical protein
MMFSRASLQFSFFETAFVTSESSAGSRSTAVAIGDGVPGGCSKDRVKKVDSERRIASACRAAKPVTRRTRAFSTDGRIGVPLATTCNVAIVAIPLRGCATFQLP